MLMRTNQDVFQMVTITKPLTDFPSYKEWWHQVELDHRPYPCYAIPLFLPSDREARCYVKTFGREIDLVSNENCLVIGLSKRKFKHINADLWGQIVDGEVPQGYGIAVSKLFGISFTQFPCLIFFEDICSSNHIVITLKDLTAEGISKVMRELFSVIQKAVSGEKSVLSAIEQQRRKKEFIKAGQTIISEFRILAGRTFETAVEAWIKTVSGG